MAGRDPDIVSRGGHGVPGLRVWQGFTGIWFWQLDDKHGGLLNRDVSGQAQTREQAVACGKAAQKTWTRQSTVFNPFPRLF